MITEFDVRPPDADLPARVLSGGNQQKLVIGRSSISSRRCCWLLSRLGSRHRAIEFIHSQLVALRDRGAAILLVSAELEEVISLSDRILVMYQGELPVK